MRHNSFPYVDGPRHSDDWYDRRGEDVTLTPGARFFVACEGGPCASRLEIFPPRLEIEMTNGAYVLLDGGPREQWRYVWAPHAP